MNHKKEVENISNVSELTVREELEEYSEREKRGSKNNLLYISQGTPHVHILTCSLSLHCFFLSVCVTQQTVLLMADQGWGRDRMREMDRKRMREKGRGRKRVRDLEQAKTRKSWLLLPDCFNSV